MKNIRDSAAIRTQDLLLRRQLLYPAELQSQKKFTPRKLSFTML